MWPLGAPLQAGVRRVPGAYLQRGDVVAFIADDARALWLHRVVGVDSAQLVTRGDTNTFDDPPVPFSAVLGRVEALRLGRFVVPIPQGGPLGRLQRQAGILWSQLAPKLRSAAMPAGKPPKGA